MTRVSQAEERWLTSSDPFWMIDFLQRPAARPAPSDAPMMSDRKCRLFAAACLGWADDSGIFEFVGLHSASAYNDSLAVRIKQVGCNGDSDSIRTDKKASEIASLLREIAGNPFRPVSLPLGERPCPDCAPGEADENCDDCGGSGTVDAPCPWLTPQVVSLATAAYSERVEDGTLDPLTLAALADELEFVGVPPEEDAPCPRCSPHQVEACPECDGKRRVAASRERHVGERATVRCPTCRGDGKFPPGYHPARDVASGRHEGGWTNCQNCNGGKRGQVRHGVVRAANPILAHLRGAGPHVRGCFAVDAILGKE